MKDVESLLTKNQLLHFDGWAAHHHPCARKYESAIGGSLTYEITPTGLGPIIIVKCNGCQEKINLTEFQNW